MALCFIPVRARIIFSVLASFFMRANGMVKFDCMTDSQWAFENKCKFKIIFLIFLCPQDPKLKQLAEQLQGFPDWRLASVETALRQTLSLADVLVWEHFFGLTRAAEIVAVVDPWVLPGEKERAKIGVKGFVQQAVDKAKHANKSLIFTPLKACQPTCCLQS